MVVRRRLDITGSALVFMTTTVQDWAPIFSHTDLVTIALTQLEEAFETTNGRDVEQSKRCRVKGHHVIYGSQDSAIW